MYLMYRNPNLYLMDFEIVQSNTIPTNCLISPEYTLKLV